MFKIFLLCLANTVSHRLKYLVHLSLSHTLICICRLSLSQTQANHLLRNLRPVLRNRIRAAQPITAQRQVTSRWSRSRQMAAISVWKTLPVRYCCLHADEQWVLPKHKPRVPCIQKYFKKVLFTYVDVTHSFINTLDLTHTELYYCLIHFPPFLFSCFPFTE